MASKKPGKGGKGKPTGDKSSSEEGYETPFWVENIILMSSAGCLALEPKSVYDKALIGVDSKGRFVYLKDRVIRCVMETVVNEPRLAEKYYAECLIPSLLTLENGKEPIIVQTSIGT